MTIKFKKIDHLQICVPKGKDKQARAFYIGTLGLKEIPKPEYLKVNGGFWLEIADIQLHIGEEEKVHLSKRHPAFEVEDLEQVKAYLIENKIKIRMAHLVEYAVIKHTDMSESKLLTPEMQ